MKKKKFLSEKEVGQIIANANDPKSTSLGRAIQEVGMRIRSADTGVIRFGPRRSPY